MTTQATVNLSTIASIPLETIRRSIKLKAQYVLGIAACSDLESSLPSESWQQFLVGLVGAMTSEWKVTPYLVLASDNDFEIQSRQVSKNRYNLVDEVSVWRQHGLSVVDLGQNDTTRLCRYGRHCDGVALVACGDLGAVKKHLRNVKQESIPWIGYWTLGIQESKTSPIAA